MREALEIRTKAAPPGRNLIAASQSALGKCLTAQQRYEEAEPLLTDGYNALNSKLPEKRRSVVEARRRLTQLYDAWGKPEEAARYR